MSTSHSKVTMEEVVMRLAELETEQTHLVEQLTALRAERPAVTKQKVVPSQQHVSERSEQPGGQETTGKRKSRRHVLRRALWATATIVGAGAFLQSRAGTAQANGNEGPTTFTSTTSGTPAVTAIGSNGADGIDVSTDSGTGVSSISSSGTGLVAHSSSGTGVTASSRTGTATYSSSVSGTGVLGQSINSGMGVYGTSRSGPGVTAHSDFGPALQVQGTVQVQGNAVGQVTLPAGSTSVTVTTPAATPTSNILLTPLGKAILWISARAAGSFTIHASTPSSSNVDIAYLIIN